MEFTHREYIGDITTSSSAATFANQSVVPNGGSYPQLQINPGNAAIFPILANIASTFVHYIFDELTFIFESTSADALNSTNTALGIVMARAELDPNIGIDSNMFQFLNTHGALKKAPNVSWIFNFPVLNQPKYVRVETGNASGNWGLPSNRDIRLYDIGWFNVATTGFQGTSVNIGQLHVQYKVRLFRPILRYTGGTPRSYISRYSSGTAPTAANPLNGTWVVQTNGNNNALAMTQNSTTTISFPPNINSGYYVVILGLLGTSTACNFTDGWSFTNCEGISNEAIPVHYAPTATGTTERIIISRTLQVTAQGATVGFSGLTTIPATITAASVSVFQINGNTLGNP